MQFGDKDEHVYFWFPLLAGLSELTFDPRPDIRHSALEVTNFTWKLDEYIIVQIIKWTSWCFLSLFMATEFMQMPSLLQAHAWVSFVSLSHRYLF